MALKAALGLCFFEQRGMFCPVGGMARTALALEQGWMNGGGRHIQADTAVTSGAEFILGGAQQPRCRGVVEHMAGAALLLLHRRVLHPASGRGVIMAFDTHLTLRRAQQIIGPRGRLMRGVAFETVARAGVGVMCAPLIQLGMTSEAQAMLFILEERRAVAGMGQVTRGAVPLHYGGMSIGLTRLILHSGVAAQAQTLLRSLECEGSPLMAGGAFALGHRGMDGCAPQRWFAPSVGIVTFGATGGGDTSVRRAYRRSRVTAGTQVALLLMQEFRCCAAVGCMTGATSLVYRRMSLRAGVLILRAGVALKTQILFCYRIKARVLSPMGLVTRIAVPPLYGLMDVFGELCGAELLMTGIAHRRHRFEQICPADNAVIAMASMAVFLLNRIVDHALLCKSVIFFVAFEA